MRIIDRSDIASPESIALYALLDTAILAAERLGGGGVAITRSHYEEIAKRRNYANIAIEGDDNEMRLRFVESDDDPNIALAIAMAVADGHTFDDDCPACAKRHDGLGERYPDALATDTAGDETSPPRRSGGRTDGARLDA